MQGRRQRDEAYVSQCLELGWRRISSYPGYFACAGGHILGPSGKVLKPFIDRKRFSRAYAVVSLPNHKRGAVNRLVCEAFHGPAPSPKHDAAHWNGNRFDNTASNLRWATRAENQMDKFAHGNVFALDDHPRATMTSEIAAAIRREHAEALATRVTQGKTQVPKGFRQILAKRYGIKVSAVKDVIIGRCW